MVDKDKVRKLVENNKKSYKAKIRKRFPETYQDVKNLDGDSFPEKLYRWIYPYDDSCFHQNCNAKTEFLSIGKGYRKYCSSSCSSSGRFDEFPEMREKASDKFKRLWKEDVYDAKAKEAMSWSGRSHSEEYKQHMSEVMKGRNVTWNDKIKENHWSNRDDANEIVDQILESREQSEQWDPDENVRSLLEWCRKNPEKAWSGRRYESGWYESEKTGGKEFYHSGFERSYMEMLDEDSNIDTWTKDHGIRIEYEYDGDKHEYIPDFLIDDKKLVETKGWVRDKNKHESKTQAASEWCEQKGIEFEVVYQNER